MNATMLGSLNSLLDEAEADDEVRVLILTGGLEGFFIQHYDVEELVEVGEAVEAAPVAQAVEQTELHVGNQIYMKIEELSKPVIAAINGMATGGGFELALTCDFRYAAADALVGLPEVHVGILPGGSGTQRMLRLIGLPKAMDLILRGRVVDAETAERLGIVHHVTAPEKLMDEAMALAEEFVAKPAITMAQTKKCLRKGLELPLREALLMEQEAFTKLVGSKEVIELMQTYVNETGQGPEQLLDTP